MMQVACAADEAYLPHCAAMLHSILERHAQQGVAIHFLHSPDLTDAVVRPVAEMVARQGGAFHAHCIPDGWVAGLPRMDRIPAVMWYRIFLPQLLPEQSRVLYLDCDTLLVGDLSPLWATSLAGCHVAAVANVLEPAVQDWPRRLGLPESQLYFNSGVLLLNLDSMRENKLTQQLLDYGRNRAAELRWPDQDALNVVLGTRCKWLHPRWNCQNSLFYYPRSVDVFGKQQVREATREPAILHFEGHHIVKPWHYLSKHPYRKLYFEHRSHTPWPRVTLQQRTLTNALLRLLPTNGAIAVLRLYYRLRGKLTRLCT